LAEHAALIQRIRSPIITMSNAWAAVSLAFWRCDFSAAEHLALAAYRRQRDFGDLDAPMWLAAHESLRRRELGLVPETPESVLPEAAAGDVRWLDGLRLWWTALRGDAEEASELVDHHVPRVLAWRGAAWLTWMAFLVEAACVGESPWIERLYDELLPYAGVVILHRPHPTLGATDHYLGLAARALDRPDIAVAHFERAVELHRRVEALPWQYRSAVESAAALGEIDPEAAVAELDLLDPDLERFGLLDLRRRSNELRSSLSAGFAPTPGRRRRVAAG
jgi:hypothetical protein